MGADGNSYSTGCLVFLFTKSNRNECFITSERVRHNGWLFYDLLFQPRRYLSARIKVAGKTMPVYTMLTSMVFYTVNGYLIGHYFGQLRDYPIEWLYDPRFIIGVALFLFGFFVNIHSIIF